MTPTKDKELIERLLCEAQTMRVGSLEQTMYVVARYLAERGKEAVAQIGDVFQIDWVGRGPIAPIVEKHGLKVGDFLYAAPPTIPECHQLEAFVVFDGDTPQYCASYSEACHEHINNAINNFDIEGAEKWRVVHMIAAAGEKP